MKRIILSAIILASLLIVNISCKKAKDAANKTVEVVGDAAEKTADAAKEVVEKTGDAIKEGAEKVVDVVANKEQLEKGKALFTSKTCVACHAVDKKVIGPSIKDIVKVYADKKANMVKFLKGNSPAIVDTDPAQVAVMKANLDGFVKDMSAEELQAITAYMRSVAK